MVSFSLVVFVSLLWGMEVAQAIPAVVEYRQIVTSASSYSNISAVASITASPSNASALSKTIGVGSSSFFGTGTYGFNLSSYCSSRMFAFAETYIPTLTTSTRTFFEGWDAAGNKTGPVVTQSYYPTTEIYSQDPFWAWSEGAATPPCCESCILSALTVQFYYWPDQATATPVPHQNNTGLSAIATTAVDSNGFTFTSPSVYIAFSTLSAQDYCGIVGTAVYNTTIALNSDEISTWPPSTTYWVSHSLTTDPAGEVWSQYVTENATQPPVRALTYTDLGRNCSTIAGYAYFPANPSAYFNDADPCHPIIAIPTRVQSLQQAWVDKGCSQRNAFGFYDPPEVLTPASSLEPASIPAAPARTTSVPGPTQSSHSANVPNSPSASETQVTHTTKTTDSSQSSPASTKDTSNTSGSAGQTESSNSEEQETKSALEPASSIVPQPSTATAEPASSESIIPSSTTGPKQTTYVIGGQSSSVEPLQNAGQSQGQIQSSPQGGTTTSGIYFVPAVAISNTEQGQTTKGTEQHPASSNSQPILQTITLDDGQITTNTIAQPAQSSSQAVPALVVGGITYSADSASQYILPGGRTLSPGGSTVTIDGTPMAIVSGGSSAIIGDSTVAITPAPSTGTSNLPLNVGGLVLTPSGSQYILPNGQTLSADGSTVTIDGTPVAIPSGGSAVIVGGSTYSVSPAEATKAGPLPVVTIGTAVITPTGNQYILPDGQTISAGGATGTLDGTPIAIPTGGSEVLVSSSTLVGTSPAEAAAPSITVAGQTITANSAGAYVLSGSTLSVGGSSITVGDDVYGIQTNSVGQTELVVGGVGTSSANIASYILSALGAIESASSARAETDLLLTSTGSKSGSTVSKTGVTSDSRSNSGATSITSPGISTGVPTATDAGIAAPTTKKSDAILRMRLDRKFVAIGLTCCVVLLI